MRKNPVAIESVGVRAFAGVLGDLVSGELLGREAVVRLVIVERAGDVVSIAPRVRSLEIVRKARGIGVTHDVEPMTRRLFAVVGARQQSIH